MNTPHTPLTSHESDYLRDALPVQEYPPELLAARRAEFVAKLRAYTDPDHVDGTSDVSEWQDERNSKPII